MGGPVSLSRRWQRPRFSALLLHRRSRQKAGVFVVQLEQERYPFSHGRDNYTEVMRHAIALNGSFFNTHRMMEQYVLNAYFR